MYTSFWSLFLEVIANHQHTTFDWLNWFLKRKIEFRTFQIIGHFYMSHVCPSLLITSCAIILAPFVKIFSPKHSQIMRAVIWQKNNQLLPILNSQQVKNWISDISNYWTLWVKKGKYDLMNSVTNWSYSSWLKC